MSFAFRYLHDLIPLQKTSQQSGVNIKRSQSTIDCPILVNKILDVPFGLVNNPINFHVLSKSHFWFAVNSVLLM